MAGSTLLVFSSQLSLSPFAPRRDPKPFSFSLLSLLSLFVLFAFHLSNFRNLSRRANHMARRTTRRYLLPLRRSRASVAETENPSKQNEAKCKTKVEAVSCSVLAHRWTSAFSTKVILKLDYSLSTLSLSLSLCVVSQSEQSKLLAIKRRGVTSTFQRSHLGLARKRE